MAMELKQSWTSTASEFITYNSTNLAVGIALGMCSAYAVSSIMYGTRPQESSEPVLIRGRAFHGCSADIFDDMKKYLEQCRASHGDIFTLKMGYNSYTTFIMDNAMLKKVLLNKHASFPAVSIPAKRRFGLHEITDELPNGIDILSHAFHDAFSDKANLAMLTAKAHTASQRVLQNLLDSLHDDWTECTQTLNEWVRGIVVRLELEIFFGKLFADDSQLIDLYFTFVQNVPLRLNTKQQTVISDVMQPLAGRIQYLCEQYEEQLDAEPLPYCIAWANDFCRKHNLSMPLCRNRLIVELLWATLPNSYHSVTWIMYHVLKEKQCEFQILKELQSVPFFELNAAAAGGNSDVKILQLRQLFPSLCAMVNEVFRFYGQSNVYRCLQDDVFIKDPKDSQRVYKLRRGDWVAGCSSFLHRNETYFENGHQFKWNRFVDDPATNQRRKISRFNQKKVQHMFTFGTKCVGRHFAENAIAIFTAFLLKNFEIKILEKNGNGNEESAFKVPRIGKVGAFSIVGIDVSDDLPFQLRRRAQQSLYMSLDESLESTIAKNEK